MSFHSDLMLPFMTHHEMNNGISLFSLSLNRERRNIANLVVNQPHRIEALESGFGQS